MVSAHRHPAQQGAGFGCREGATQPKLVGLGPTLIQRIPPGGSAALLGGAFRREEKRCWLAGWNPPSRGSFRKVWWGRLDLRPLLT